MATDTTLGPPADPVRSALERVAWDVVRLSSRRLFVVLALTASAALAASGVVGTWVATRNTSTITSARESGLGLASTVTEFGTRLAAFDADSATMLLPGGLDRPPARPGYDPNVLETGRSLAGYDPNLVLAARALVDAGLVATEEDREDLRTLNDGLVRYTRLVEEARANARQGYPVSAVYLEQARTLAREDLLPVADRLRRTGEQRVARAANSVGGPLTAAGVGFMAAALVVLVLAALLVAGRTRRLIHPVVLAAMLVAAGALIIVTTGIWSQSRELRLAATDEIDVFVAANEVASDLSDLRVTEIAAVATQGNEESLYEDFRGDAEGLTDRLARDPPSADLLVALESYVEEVEQVALIDLEQGGQSAAQRSTLRGASATNFRRADDAAAGVVARSASSLDKRFDAAAAADVEPLQPVTLGTIAAALAAAGLLGRGRLYW